jgi:two-component sensor histidine kinase
MSEATRLLYIDDDEGLCRLAARNLARLGYAVDTAQDGATGCAMAARDRYDAIVVDHYMPGMDGLATLACLRETDDTPPVVYVTGSEEGRIAVAALKAGAADYVVKTVGEDFFALLDSAIAQAIERRALERGKRLAEDELRASNARLETLLREVNHRVANSLQVVSALVQLQSHALGDPQAQSALADTRRRIEAIAQVHRRLYTGHAVDRVAVDDYLGALAVGLEETWSTPDTPFAIRLACDPIEIQADRAVSLGVIVNELVSNACKYAYPASTGGEVRITLTREGEDGFRLVVEDDGCGIDRDAAPRGTGIGARVVTAMARSLRGSIDYDEMHAGARVVLRAALA